MSFKKKFSHNRTSSGLTGFINAYTPAGLSFNFQKKTIY